jgi:hypothetical protein
MLRSGISTLSRLLCLTPLLWIGANFKLSAQCLTVTTSNVSEQTTGCLQTSGTVSVNAGNTVTYNAGSTIYLQQGFHAYPNSSFVAQIGNGNTNQPVITTTSLPSGTVGTFYSSTLQATETSCNGSFTWTMTGPSINLTLTTGGSLSGYPSAAGTSYFTFTATDSSGRASTPVSLSVTISTGGGTNISITTTAIPGATLSSNGLLSGTPVVANSFPFAVSVTDTANHSTSGSFTISAATNSSTILGNSYLHSNLGYLPVSFYSYSNPTSNAYYRFYYPNTGQSSCPPGSTVRGCFQSALSSLRAQGVSGVRIFIQLCDSSSQAFPQASQAGKDCGTPLQTWSTGAWNPAANNGQATWLANLTTFFTDVKNAGINNVAITIEHSEGVTDQLGTC